MITFPLFLRLQDQRSLMAGRLRAGISSRLAPGAWQAPWTGLFARVSRQITAQRHSRATANMIKTSGAIARSGLEAEGSVALVGAGPGSTDLITLRGVQRLQQADVIFYDRLIDPAVLDLARRGAEQIYVGKAPGCHHWPQDKISAALVAVARQGKRVVRLKCGDPGVFARGAEEVDALSAAGIPYEIVPGVTAASAASAALGGFLTERGTCDRLVLATGQSQTAGKPLDWMSSLQPGTRVAVYMGVGSAPKIAQALIAADLDDHVSIDIVSRAQQCDQVIAQCRASTLMETINSASISNPAILFLTRPHSTPHETPAANKKLEHAPLEQVKLAAV